VNEGCKVPCKRGQKYLKLQQDRRWVVPLVGTSGVTVASCLSGDEMLRVTRVPWGLSRWRGVRQLATVPTGLAATRDQATLGRPVLGHRALPPGVG
jgi:hypothetical protein